MAYSTKYILEYTAAILIKFSELVDKWVRMISLTFFLQSPKGRCYGTQLILVAKIAH